MMTMKPIKADEYYNLVFADLGMVDGETKSGNKKKYRTLAIICPDCKEKFITRADRAKGKLLRCLSCSNSKNSSKHNCSTDKLYKVWVNMKSRCNNPNHHKYSCYGAKGISVCDEWQNSFSAFKDWSTANGYKVKDSCHKEKMSIDRINPKLGYSPDNCQWITVSENTKKRFKDQLAKEKGLL